MMKQCSKLLLACEVCMCLGSLGDLIKEHGFSTKNTKLFWSHGVRLLEQLNIQRNFETFCDVVVHVGASARFSAHRCILAASSTKLYTLMFATSNDCMRNVHLDGVSVSGFKIVLEFIYTGILSFDSDTLTDVITVANYLEMPALVRICEEFVNSRRIVDDDSVKVEGSNSSSPLFRSTPVAPTETAANYSRSSAGRLSHSGMGGTTSSASPGRLLPSANALEDYLSVFDPYYSTSREHSRTPV